MTMIHLLLKGQKNVYFSALAQAGGATISSLEATPTFSLSTPFRWFWQEKNFSARALPTSQSATPAKEKPSIASGVIG